MAGASGFNHKYVWAGPKRQQIWTVPVPGYN